MASREITDVDERRGEQKGRPQPDSEQLSPLSNSQGNHGSGWMAERLAAEGLEQDRARWIKFNPSTDDMADFEKFLQTNLPSRTESSDGIGWICVRAPHFGQTCDDEDIDGLEEAWEELQESGRPIDHDVIFDLAKAHRCLSGKWCIHIDSGFKIDHAWQNIARAVVSGQCGTAAKVSPHRPNARGRDCNHVICVYCDDFTDQAAVFELEASLRKEAGIKCSMGYKPDAFTYLGIYRRNKWELRPIIYNSVYDCKQRRSRITPVSSREPEQWAGKW